MLFPILYLLLLSTCIQTKSDELFCLSQILQKFCEENPENGGGYPFTSEEQISLEPIVPPLHISMSNNLKGCSSGLTQLTL